MKFTVILGSISEKSNNRKLAELFKKQYSDKFDIEILTLEKIPMYNEDDELNPCEIITSFREKVKNSDGLVFITPEYNHSIPGVLKNALDWSSRIERIMLNKPVMILGGSTGAMGTVRAQSHLRQILNSPGIGAVTLPLNEVLISNIEDKIVDGSFDDKSTIEFLDKTVDKFVKWVNKVNCC